MAQSGYTPISLYFSTTASAVPTAGNLANGELALNTADMKLYAKNSAGVVTLLASNAATSGVSSFSAGTTGFTPSTGTTGAVTLAGTLATTNGGTGRTAYTANSVLYASSTSAIASGSALTFDGTNFASTGSLQGSTLKTTRASGSQPEVVFTQTGVASWSLYNPPSSTDLRFYNGSDLLTLASTGNLGLGVTPSAWNLGKAIEVGFIGNALWSASATQNNLSQNAYYASGWKYGSTNPATYYNQQSGAHAWYNAPSGTAGNAITFTQAMTLDGSGNLGLGVTPSAWNSAFKVFENGAKGAAFFTHTSNYSVNLSANAYYDSVGYKYGNTAPASYYNQYNGIHSWFTAPSGTAGNAITFTQAMTLSAAGGFSVGTTADPGAGAIYATGNITAYYSDERLKDVKGRITNALAKVRRLSGVYYTNNETAKSFGYTSDEMQVGVLANQMKGELPEIVKPAPFDLDENGNSKSGENYMTVQYERGFPLLIEALKELAGQFDDYVATH